MPVVFELKYSKFSSGVNRLLGPIIQGFAYSLTLRYYWEENRKEEGGIRSEWESAFQTSTPESLRDSETPIVITANSEFWEAGQTWSHLPWSRFLEIADNLARVGLPLYAAKFQDLENPDLSIFPFHRLHGDDTGSAPIRWPEN